MAFEPRRIEVDDRTPIKKSADVSNLFIEGNVVKPPIPGMNGPAWEPDIQKTNVPFFDGDKDRPLQPSNFRELKHQERDEKKKLIEEGEKMQARANFYEANPDPDKKVKKADEPQWNPENEPWQNKLGDLARGNHINLLDALEYSKKLEDPYHMDKVRAHIDKLHSERIKKSDFNDAQSPHNPSWAPSEDKKNLEEQKAKREKWVHETNGGKRKGIKKAVDSLIEYIEKSTKAERAIERQNKKNRGASAKDKLFRPEYPKDYDGPDIEKAQTDKLEESEGVSKMGKKYSPSQVNRGLDNASRRGTQDDGETWDKFLGGKGAGKKPKTDKKDKLPKPMKKALGMAISIIANEIKAEMQKSNKIEKVSDAVLEGQKRHWEATTGAYQQPKGEQYNPQKITAGLRVKKAIILSKQQLGESFVPVNDITLVKAFGSIDAIPDLMKTDRMPQDFFNIAFEKASIFSDKPLEFVGNLWYGETIFKGVLGAGIGALAGGALAGPVGAVAGGMGGTAVEDKIGKEKKAKKSMDIPWTKSEFEEFTKGVLGAGLGGLAGGALAGPAGAAAGAMGGTAIEDKIAKPKKQEVPAPEPVDKQWQAIALEAVKDPKATGKGIKDAGEGIKSAAEGISSLQPTKFGRANPKMIKEKCVNLCKAIVKAENGTDDLTSLTTEQFGRAFIQASYTSDIESDIIDKAVAEPIDSKFAPKQREPDSDFGGESEVSGNPTTADPSMLKPSEKKEIVVQKNNAAKDK